MNEANCYAVLPQESDNVDVGQAVTIQPFDHLIS
jgi:molybdopterin biosynthesis enzyme